MKTLAFIVIFQLICRLFNQTPLEAIASTLFLLLFVMICYRFGGWRSRKEAWTWLKSRPLIAWLVGTGVVGTIGLAVHSGKFDLASISAEAISAYFFFHAFCALGDWLLLRFKKS